MSLNRYLELSLIFLILYFKAYSQQNNDLGTKSSGYNFLLPQAKSIGDIITPSLKVNNRKNELFLFPNPAYYETIIPNVSNIISFTDILGKQYLTSIEVARKGKDIHVRFSKMKAGPYLITCLDLTNKALSYWLQILK